MKKIWKKIKLILLWMGISLVLMIVGAIVIGAAALLLIFVPFLVLFPYVRERIWEDLVSGGGWKKRKVEAKVVPIKPQENKNTIDEDQYYYFSR